MKWTEWTEWTEYLGIFCVPTARFFREKNLKIFSLYSMRRCVHQLSQLFRVYDKHFHVLHDINFRHKSFDTLSQLIYQCLTALIIMIYKGPRCDDYLLNMY